MWSKDFILDLSWGVRSAVANGLRKVAGKIAEDTTYRMPGLVARFVEGKGIQVSWKSTGAPGFDLFYREDEYDKAFTPEGEAYDG